MSDLLTLIQDNGPLGLFVGLVVLLAVYGLSYAGVTVTGKQKQLANVIISILSAGVSLVNPDQPEVIVAAIASIVSGLAYNFIQFITAEVEKKKAAAAAAPK